MNVPKKPVIRTIAHRGQVLVITAGILTILIALVGLIVDLGWYQSNLLSIQRSADAAALAGVVYLPANVGQAQTTAYAEATKNGYTTGGVTTVTATQDLGNPRRLNVTIKTEVPTYFIRIFGMDTISATRDSSAEFVLPVPMGSPLNYYGVGCMDTNGDEPPCTQNGNGTGDSGVPDATLGSSVTGASAPQPQLDSQGFWGAVFTRGGDSRNGDAFSPTDFSGGLGGGGGANLDYDPAGYGYSVEIPAAGGGKVYVFDPMFCGMPTLGSGRAGTGDEWTGALGGASNPSPVTTYYNLWDTNGTPNLADDMLVYTSGNLFVNGLNNDGVEYVDLSGAHGSGSPQYAGTSTDCAGSQYHLQWWQVPTGLLAQGIYRLQVTSTNVQLPPIGSSGFGGGTLAAALQPSDAVGAANRFSLEVTSAGGAPRVYGAGRMAAYTNMQSGTQNFYLAQIDRSSGRGKTIQIELYDPGDVGGGAWLQFLNPDGASYSPATFSFTSVSKAGNPGPSGTNVTCIETNHPGSAPAFPIPAGCPTIFDGTGNQFDSFWLTITIPLPSSYGTVIQNSGWWKIQYTVGGGNDTTTWQVAILGNPVHLVLP
ncbi:MAG: pilus assembly protein TadG-related protein [Chloroflexota bacterium]|nr:pilus assembly protein TadG-related protein [Chloroflexota bacterium]